MDLPGITRAELGDYLAAQVSHFFPDGKGDVHGGIGRDLDEALDRMGKCADAVALWTPGSFNYLHSEQNTVFLWFLANTIWRNREDERLCSKLFYLNKALNGFTCFYYVPMPDIWFVGHSPGTVLVNTTYGEYFAVYHGCTVGQSAGERPAVGARVLMYPGSAILGRSSVGDGTVLAQGATLIDRDTEGDCVVGRDGAVKPARRPILSEIFRGLGDDAAAA